MTYDITITFTVSGLENGDAAEEMGLDIASHVRDTYNDDESIGPLVDIKTKRRAD